MRDDDTSPTLGVPPATLTDEELLRELSSLHSTRHETFRHGSDDALTNHSRRTDELERQYLRRFPDREIDPAPPPLNPHPVPRRAARGSDRVECTNVAGDWRSGSALRSHRRGHWFDPSIAHRRSKAISPSGRWPLTLPE